MDNVVPINSLKEKPPAIDAFVLRSHISKKALEVTNDESYIPFEIDPIGYIEARNKQHISDVLGKLSLTSTRSYIRTFLQCMKYMTNFESKI